MAGFYLNDDPGPGPWGINLMRELLFIVQDKVFKEDGELWLDEADYHKDMHFGDVNLVSGKAWPKIPVEPAFHHIRFLVASLSRPYLLNIKDKDGNVVSDKICAVSGLCLRLCAAWHRKSTGCEGPLRDTRALESCPCLRGCAGDWGRRRLPRHPSAVAQGGLLDRRRRALPGVHARGAPSSNCLSSGHDAQLTTWHPLGALAPRRSFATSASTPASSSTW